MTRHAGHDSGSNASVDAVSIAERCHGSEVLCARSVTAIDRRPDQLGLFSGTNWLAMNIAPCGSLITAMRTHGASNGPATTSPPSSRALAAVSSALSTANVTLQCAGVSE